MVVLKKKSHQRQIHIDLVDARTSHFRVPYVLGTEGALLPLSGALDPAAGELDLNRAFRKRAQISSTATHVLGLLRTGDHVVEFGAGSGHLGLLLATIRPDCSVTLVEIKEWTCNFAQNRANALALTNCKVFCGSVDDFAASGSDFDCAVGLHCCGLLFLSQFLKNFAASSLTHYVLLC